jgi:hypothetical protein
MSDRKQRLATAIDVIMSEIQADQWACAEIFHELEQGSDLARAKLAKVLVQFATLRRWDRWRGCGLRHTEDERALLS